MRRLFTGSLLECTKPHISISLAAWHTVTGDPKTTAAAPQPSLASEPPQPSPLPLARRSCGYVFCSGHRHAQDHSCTFDYAAFDKANLAKANNKVGRGAAPWCPALAASSAGSSGPGGHAC